MVPQNYKCILCPVEHTEHDFVEPAKANTSKKKLSEKEKERERVERENAQKAADYYRKKQEESNRPVNPREPLKRTADNNWVHVTCAVWTPEVKFGNAKALAPSEGIPLVPRSRYSEACKLCKKQEGACVSCSYCKAPVHVECAHQAGYLLGFEINPVKGSRRDQHNIVSINGESGNMSAAIWCKEHPPTKTVVHRMHDPVDDTGLNALQLYCHSFKQADLTLTGCARKANQIMVGSKMSTSPAATGTPNRRASTATLLNGDREHSPTGGQPGGKVCLTCGIDVSPKWYPIDQTQERELTNGHYGSLVTEARSEAQKFVEQRSFQCHKCKKANRQPKPHSPPREPTPPPPAPVSAPVSAPVPVSVPASVSVPVSVSVSVPVSVPVPISVPTPAPVSAPAPVPVLVPVTAAAAPAPAPELVRPAPQLPLASPPSVAAAPTDMRHASRGPYPWSPRMQAGPPAHVPPTQPPLSHQHPLQAPAPGPVALAMPQPLPVQTTVAAVVPPSIPPTRGPPLPSHYPPANRPYNDWHRQHSPVHPHRELGPPSLAPNMSPALAAPNLLRPPPLGGMSHGPPPPPPPIQNGHLSQMPYMNGMPPSPRRMSGPPPPPPPPPQSSPPYMTNHGPPDLRDHHRSMGGMPPLTPTHVAPEPPNSLNVLRQWSHPPPPPPHHVSPPMSRESLPPLSRDPGLPPSQNRPASGASASPSLRNLLS